LLVVVVVGVILAAAAVRAGIKQRLDCLFLLERH
jgi:hypothetical protein